jgi:hypothetical protein
LELYHVNLWSLPGWKRIESETTFHLSFSSSIFLLLFLLLLFLLLLFLLLVLLLFLLLLLPLPPFVLL